MKLTLGMVTEYWGAMYAIESRIGGAFEMSRDVPEFFASRPTIECL
jgi:hypothetical protein